MQDMVDELIPSEQDEAILAAWETGKKLRSLSREFKVSVMQVEQAIDRCLPVFDGANQLRAYKRELRKLEDLGTEFYAIAMRDKDPESAHIVARINERICSMRGWSSVNIRMDPYTAPPEAPSRHEKIREVIMRLTQPEQFQQPNGGDGQSGSSPDPEPSR
jgi:hypothetical protein